MRQIQDPKQMARWARQVRARGESIAFVPTMGFLHAGHLSLMRALRGRADHLVVSIFVNPLQFGAGEDLDHYPRDADGDAAQCLGEGVDVLFLPRNDTMYPEGFQTTLRAGPLAGHLCGASREGHFDGVLTVVLKLFHLVQPTAAAFGRKDYQQLQVIRRMVRDLDLDIDVVAGDIVREPDGLAMSSRNVYLSAEERQQALALSRSLDAARAAVLVGQRDAAGLAAACRGAIAEQPLADIDYVELVDAETLADPGVSLERDALLAVAVRFGTTRLIDNALLPVGQAP